MKKIILIALSLISVYANTFCMEKDPPNTQQMVTLKFNNNENMQVPAEIARTSQFVSTMINLKLRSQQIKTEQESAVDLKEMDKNYFNNQIYPYMKLIHGNNREQIITNLNNTNDINALLELAKNANKLDLGKSFLQHVCTRTANKLSSDNQLDQFQNGLSYSIIDPDVRLKIKQQFNPSFKFPLIGQNIKNTAREYKRIPNTHHIYSCTLSPNKKYALVSSSAWEVTVLDLTNNGKKLLDGDDFNNTHFSTCFTSDNKYALVAGDLQRGKIQIYDILTGKGIQELKHDDTARIDSDTKLTDDEKWLVKHCNNVSVISCIPKSNQIFTFSMYGTLKIWNKNNGTYQCTQTIPIDIPTDEDGMNEFDIAKIDLSNTGNNILATRKDKGGIDIIELKNNCLEMKKNIPGHFISSCFVPNNNGILVTADKGAKILDQKTGKVTQTFADHTCKITSGLPSSDGRLVVTTYQDGLAKIFSVKNGKHLATLKIGQPEDRIVAHHLGPDGKLILIHNNQVKIWNVFDPQLIDELNNLLLNQKQLLTLMQRKPSLKIANHKHLTDIYKNLPNKTKQTVEAKKQQF